MGLETQVGEGDGDGEGVMQFKVMVILNGF